MRFQVHIRRGLLCGLVAALFLPSPAAAETTLVSREGEPPGTTGRGYLASLSADGRFVGFWDGAVTLVRDLQAGTTVVASRASGAQGAIADASPFPPSLSTDGRFVAFTSPARTLDPDDGDDAADVYVRDLLEGTTTLVSRASGSSAPKGNRESYDPSISGDGRFVAFASRASNLDQADTEPTPAEHGVGIDPAWDIFVRDLATGTTALVSRAGGAGGSDGKGASLAPSISADGRFVAFQSFATNLHPEDTDPTGDIYVRDLVTATTIFVGRGPAAARPRMVHDAAWPSISSDGQAVAFSNWGAIFLWHARTRTTARVDVASSKARANSDSEFPSLSGNGRYVAFSSYATNLQLFHTAPFPDVFVRDLDRGTTVLASRASGPFGAPGSGGSREPSISADGRLVAFESRSSNLDPQDPDRRGDIFVRDLGTPPFDEPGPVFCGGRRATTLLLPGSPPFRGTSAPEIVVGSRTSDRIAGRAGRDRICGGGGRDRLIGGPGRDLLRSVDPFADYVECGPGLDRAVVDPRDRVRGCERVRVRRPG
jgi:Tol biopolymer transport system component